MTIEPMRLLDAVIKLRENSNSCRRAAEMYGTRAAEDWRRGYFGSAESSFLIAIRYARLVQAQDDAVSWLLHLHEALQRLERLASD